MSDIIIKTAKILVFPIVIITSFLLIFEEHFRYYKNIKTLWIVLLGLAVIVVLGGVLLFIRGLKKRNEK